MSITTTPSDALIHDALKHWHTSIVESSNDFDRMKSTLTAIMPQLFNAEPAQGEQLPQDVINLVIAARDVVYGGQIDIAHVVFDVLDKALEAFASNVPWENEPDEEAAPTPEAGR